IRAFALEPDRLTGQLLELRDARRLLVEEPLDHVRPREHEHLLEIELPVLPQDLAKDLVTDRLRRLHEAAAFAARARLTEQVLEALAGALARHLDEPERRDAHDLALRVVAGEPLRERLEHLGAMLLLRHVDEIDDDDAAQVPQPQL